MSDVQPRPSGPRGRGSSRGGRGAFGSRGGRGGPRQTNGSKSETSAETLSPEDEGEIGELKKKYASNLGLVKEMFPAWTDEDIIFALQETDGDLEATIDRISEGNVAQWEVKKKSKERSQSKPKEPVAPSNDAPSQSTRGGRGRGGIEGSRGGRGRGSDRGRGAARGGRGGLVNGSRDPAPVKKEEAAADSGWDNTPSTDGVAGSSWDSAVADTTPLESSWENITAGEAHPPAAEEPKPSSKPDGTRSWASMFSKPAPTAVPAKSQASRAAPSHEATVEPPMTVTSIPTEAEVPGLPPPPSNENPEAPRTPPTSDLATTGQAVDITPSKDDLTETNLEQVLDVSAPAPSATAASTVASTMDPGSVAPLPAARPPLGGFATSAYKAAGMPGASGRSASFQRKILEQQEAVVMPGKHAVDRAAVQFGSMGLNGSTEDPDVDSDREDAETRAQPPQHSPIAPRAALPPAPQQQAFGTQPQIDALPTPRQAPGLPPVNQAQQSSQILPGDQGASQPSNYPFNRYGPQATQVSAPAQKPYEPFGQQAQQSHDGFPPSSQAPTQQTQSTYSSAPHDAASYYTSDNQRNAYQSNHYGNYGQQPPANTQDISTSQQRGTGAFGTSTAEQTNQFPASQAQPAPSRYGQSSEAQNSGHSTPNPPHSGQQQQSQSHQMHHQGPGQGGQHGGYPYGHPYYASPYYSAYMNQVSNHSYGRDRPMFDDVRRYEDQYLSQNPQFGYGGNQGGYGGGPFSGANKGMYGQPHQGYGMSPQTSYDQHSASPANAGAFGQQHSATSGRDSAAPAGLGNYGRSGSAQPSDNSQQFTNTGSSSHGNVPDVFGRSQSGFPGQSTGLGSHMSSQQGGNEDSLRTYGDSSKVSGGLSPAPGQPSGRPGSAATPGLPPPQGQAQSQQGYGGGYMGQMHGQGGSQYGAGPAALSGHHQYGGQSHQGGGYGAYGAGYGSSSYGNSNRGGWGANYGH